jgi:hypothetical protein
MMDKVQKEKIMSVNFSWALFFRLSTHDDLAMQALVWLHIVSFTVIQAIGTARFGTLYANLRWPYIFKHQI